MSDVIGGFGQNVSHVGLGWMRIGGFGKNVGHVGWVTSQSCPNLGCCQIKIWWVTSQAVKSKFDGRCYSHAQIQEMTKTGSEINFFI